MTESRPERSLSLRVSAALVGLPLASTLFVGWTLSGESLHVLKMAEAFDHWGFVLMPLLGMLLLTAALAPLSLTLRRSLVAFAGIGAFCVGTSLIRSEQVLMELGDLNDLPMRWLLFFSMAWTVAVGLEIAMHRKPRSRGIAIAALLGWTAALLSLVNPLHGGEFERSILGLILEAYERRSRLTGEQVLPLLPMGLALVAWLQALRRIGKDRERAASRRFRTAWLGYLVMLLPMLSGYGFAIFELLERDRAIASIHNAWSFAFAGTFGAALGVSCLACLYAGWRPPTWTRRVTGAGLLGAALSVAVISVLPDARETRAAAFLDEIGEATVLGLRGQPIPTRFLGGYEEFDLRSGASALEGVAEPGAPLRLVAVAVHFGARDGSSINGWAVRSNDELRFIGSTRHAQRRWPLEYLSELDPALSDLAEFVWEGSQSLGCVDALSEEGRARLRGSLDDLAPDTTDWMHGLCDVDAPSSGGSDEYLTGGVDRYRVVVELPSGAYAAFDGELRFESRLWVGVPGQHTFSERAPSP